MNGHILVPKQKKANIRWEQNSVKLIVDGQLVLDMPWEAALELGKGLIHQARKAEEWTKAPEVIRDQAILMRAGIPLALTSDPVKRKEAGKDAAWDSDLRRAMPNHTDRIEQYGKMFNPVVKQEDPKEG